MDTKTIPKMLTINQTAQTGILPENVIRVMVKNGEIPAVYSGRKAYINFDNLCAYLNKLGEGGKNVSNRS